MASPVKAPCPISARATRIVTVLSGAITTQQVTSDAASAARAGALPKQGANGIAKPSAKPPPAALAPTRKERRSSSPPDVMNSP